MAKYESNHIHSTSIDAMGKCLGIKLTVTKLVAVQVMTIWEFLFIFFIIILSFWFY